MTSSYLLVNETGLKLSWNAARLHCKSMGRDLASIHSVTELNRVAALTNVETWIGLSGDYIDSLKTFYYHWSDGSPLDWGNTWNKMIGVNTSVTKEGCVYLTMGAIFMDANCNLQKAFVCGDEGFG